MILFNVNLKFLKKARKSISRQKNLFLYHQLYINTVLLYFHVCLYANTFCIIWTTLFIYLLNEILLPFFQVNYVSQFKTNENN